MEVTLLNKLLSRFVKNDYRFLFENWPPLARAGLTAENVDTLGKRDLIEAVGKRFKRNKLPPGIFADLDLLYLQRYPNKRIWRVFKLQQISKKKVLNDADSFEEAIANQMGLYFNGEVTVKLFNQAFWIRLEIKQRVGRARIVSSVVYVVHPKNTQYLLITGLKETLKKHILQVFLMVLKGHQIDMVHLSGRHISSLLQLVINKHSKRPTHAPARREPEEKLPDNVCNENRAHKRKREEYVDVNFGPNKQPKLETVEYKLETKLKAGDYIPEMAQEDSLFRCRVKFQGTSVLEGIKNLAEAGLAEIPMKEHLGQVHRMAQNMFVLRQKSKNATQDSS